jgi:3-methyladenine DNA glycosylase AlkC
MVVVVLCDQGTARRGVDKLSSEALRPRLPKKKNPTTQVLNQDSECAILDQGEASTEIKKNASTTA